MKKTPLNRLASENVEDFKSLRAQGEIYGAALCLAHLDVYMKRGDELGPEVRELLERTTFDGRELERAIDRANKQCERVRHILSVADGSSLLDEEALLIVSLRKNVGLFRDFIERYRAPQHDEGLKTLETCLKLVDEELKDLISDAKGSRRLAAAIRTVERNSGVSVPMLREDGERGGGGKRRR